MTADPCLVDWCDRPVGDGYICQRCADRLSRALGDVPALWEELDVVLTRQSRYSDAEGRGGEQALPFNPTASELGWALRNTLATWCRVVIEERPVIAGPVHPACLHISCSAVRRSRLPADNLSAFSAYLLGHVSWLRHHRAGHEAVEEITSIVDTIRKAVDRPAPRIYAGPCGDCGKDMYAKPDAVTVECRPCGLEYPVADMVAWMRQEARGRLVTAKEGAMLLSRFGFTTTRGRIDVWHSRKLIAAAGHNTDGKQLFLVDDLMDRAKEVAIRRGA